MPTPNGNTEELSQELERLRARVRELEQEQAEHLRTREALRTSEDRYRTLVENAPLGIIVADAEGNITVVNRALLEILGSPSAKATQAINVLRFPPLVKAGVADDFRRCIEAGRPLVSEHPYLSKWGKQSYLRYHLTPLKDAKGNLVGLQGVVEDFSDRKRFEDALKAAHESLSKTAEQLQQANEELSQFATAVSHDIKAPLRAIRHFATELLEDHAGGMSSGALTCLDKIFGAIDHADSLVADLLALSRIGRHEQVAPPVHVASFLADLVSTLTLPPNAKIMFTHCDLTIRSDPTLLRQVFQNLLLNAVTFNESPRPTVDIACSVEADGTVEIRVTDNGIGIDPRYHERIFKVFERLHARTEYEGTGIGLALAKKAVTKLGGTIDVQSAVGQGSTFVVRIPPAVDSRHRDDSDASPTA